MNDLETRLRAMASDPAVPAPGLADRALRIAHRRATRRRVGVIAATAAGAALLVAVVNLGAGVLTSTPRPAAPSPTGLLARHRENVLLIGTDSSPDRVGTRPDSIILASIVPGSGRTVLIGIPRNVGRVPFPAGSPASKAYPGGYWCPEAGTGLNDCILNSLWYWAENSGRRYYPGDPHPGLTATREAVETVTGLAVDDTVVVTMRGLQGLVDAVGGVEVDVTERIPIGGDANHRVATSWIEPGRQRLNGYQALWYARSRWSTSDVDRMARQRCLLVALGEQVDPSSLARKLPRIAGVLKDGLNTSLDLSDLRDWVTLAGRVRATRVSVLGLTYPDPDRPDLPHGRAAVRAALAAPATGTSAHRPC